MPNLPKTKAPSTRTESTVTRIWSKPPQPRALAKAREHLSLLPGGPEAGSVVCRVPDDDTVSATALAGQADLILTGDDDLLVLADYEGIRYDLHRSGDQFVAGAVDGHDVPGF